MQPKPSISEYKVTVNEQTFYMDPIHRVNLDRAKTLIRKDWDMIFIYDGVEGSGKSVKAMQDAFFCDPTLTLDRVTFTPKDFSDAIDRAGRYQAVIFDEAFRGLMSRNAMSKWNKFLVEKMAEIRQKNLFVFIVMPTFYDLDRNIAIWRTRGLVHVYTKGEDWQRGYFVFYNRDLKCNLYVNGKKTYLYKGSKFNYRGRFLNYYPLDEDGYRFKKYQSLVDKADEAPVEKKVSKSELFRLQLEKLNKSKGNKTNK